MIELPPGIELVDPRPIAAAAPYKFFLPFEAEIAAVSPGDMIKAIFRQTTGKPECPAERMWVRIEAVDDRDVIGTLDNEPTEMDRVAYGDCVRLPLAYAISTAFAAGHIRPTVPERREYWDRCFADACVIEGRSHVDYLYREEPMPIRESDRYPDSGWRLRGTQSALDADEAAGCKPRFVALGKVLNADDRWLSLIDSPIGSHFRWWPEDSAYVELE